MMNPSREDQLVVVRAEARAAARCFVVGMFAATVPIMLLVLVAWVNGWLASPLSTPLGRDPIQWRIERYLRDLPTQTIPIGFTVGCLIAIMIKRPRDNAYISLLVILFVAYSTSPWWPTRLGEAEETLHIRHDPIEDEPHVRPLMKLAEAETMVIFRDEPRRKGLGHAISGTKKRILREKYGIDWRTPAEMNPHIAFD